MRVLFLNYEYPPLGGGAGNATFYILREFSKIPGLEVDLITSSVDSEYHLEKMGENIRIHKLPIGKNKNNLHYQSQRELLVYSRRAYGFAKKLIKEKTFNLSHSFFSVPCGFISWIFYRKHNLPYIISLRGADVPGYTDRFSRLYKILKPLIKIIWKNASQVISNSEGLKELAQKSSREQKIGVIPNGINISEFRPDPAAKKPGQFVITPGASRITSRKGLSYLIEAVSILKLKYPQIMLRVIGDGDERKKLEKMAADLGIKDKVEFIGAVPHQETVKYYQEADVFVLPSLNEGMSNAMLEALACGLPIITTETGGTKELVKENENGFYVKMNDGQDITRKIEKLILDPGLKNKMSEKSQQMAQGLGWKKTADSYAGIYESVAGIGPSLAGKKYFGLGKKIKLAAKLIVMIGFITWIIYKVRWAEVLQYLREVEIWQILVFLLFYVFGIALCTYKWQIFANFKNIPAKFTRLFKIYLTGTFLNNFFPSIVGGDTYRSYQLGKAGNGRYMEATSTVMIDRITGFAGVMILILLFSVLKIDVVLNNPILIVVNLLILASFGTDILLVAAGGLPIRKFVKRFLPSLVIRLIREIRSYHSDYRVLGKAVFWGAVYNFIGVGIANWIIFWGLGIPINFSNYMISISIISVISSIPISIGNIGIKEWAYITFFGIFAVNGEAAISIAILGRFLQMVVSFFAIPYYFKEKKERIEMEDSSV